jgi:hypothetical protein
MRSWVSQEEVFSPQRIPHYIAQDHLPPRLPLRIPFQALLLPLPLHTHHLLLTGHHKVQQNPKITHLAPLQLHQFLTSPSCIVSLDSYRSLLLTPVLIFQVIHSQWHYRAANGISVVNHREKTTSSHRSNCAARKAFLSRPTSRRSTFVFVVTILGLEESKDRHQEE